MLLYYPPVFCTSVRSFPAAPSARKTRLAPTACLAMVLALWLPASVTIAETTDTDIRHGWLKHAARAQLHRWFQIHARPATGTDPALDILSNDVLVKSGNDTNRDLQAYAKHVATRPPAWKSANTVHASQVRVLDEHSLEMEAKVGSLTEAIIESGSVRPATLNFQARLERADGILPTFNHIEFDQATVSEAGTNVDSYAQNRLLSLVHYYLAGIEHPEHDPEPLKEVLARSFRLELANGSMSSYPSFAAWLRGPASQVSASTHTLHGFTYDTLAEDERYVLSMEVGWFGLRADGTRLNGKTRQIWTVSNVVSERFARIESIEEEVLEPVAPAAN